MYKPQHFALDDRELQYALIKNAPLATLITNSGDGFDANHLPFILVPEAGHNGVLRAHIPRANPLSKMAQSGHDCLAIFHGPEGYISPSLYATKAVHGKVVPTWNYQVVHVHGHIRVVDKAEWVLAQMNTLTTQMEQVRAAPWAVDDAPAEFISSLIKGLVGLEIQINSISGKIKASQNQPKENQASVLAALDATPDQSKLALKMHNTLDTDSHR